MASNNDNLPAKQPSSEFLVYTTENGQIKLEVRLENETVWLSQRLMAELFQKDIRTMPIRLTQNGALGYDPVHVRLPPDTVRVSETLP